MKKTPLTRLFPPGDSKGVFVSVLNNLVNFPLLGNTEIENLKLLYLR